MEFEKLKLLFRMFNRKERYHLVRAACEGDFRLNQEFYDALVCEGSQKAQRKSAWVAMDYHLDWISAVLFLLKSDQKFLAEFLDAGNSENTLRDIVFANQLIGSPLESEGLALEGNQQDVDLLVLMQEDSGSVFHLFMVEAKFDSGWDNKQLKIKGKRISQIFPEDSVALPGGGRLHFHWRFAGLKGKSSTKANLESFPDWVLNQVGSSEEMTNSGAYISYSPEGGRADSQSDNAELSLPVIVKPTRLRSEEKKENLAYDKWRMERVWVRSTS